MKDRSNPPIGAETDSESPDFNDIMLKPKKKPGTVPGFVHL